MASIRSAVILADTRQSLPALGVNRSCQSVAAAPPGRSHRFHLEEGYAVGPSRQGLVEDEDGGLDAGVGLEDTRGEGDDGHQVIFHEHLAELLVGVLALEDNALGHDDTGAPGGGEVLGHVVDEEHLTAFGFHRKAGVRADATFRRHERRVGQNHVGVLVPALLAGQGVVLENVRLDKAVQVEVDQRQAHHIGRDVIAL